jgi:hypothetical protein
MNDINGGTLYGMIKPGKDNEHNSRIINTLNGCSHGCTKYFDRETKEYKNYEAIEFSKDVRKGLLHVLNRIESVTEFVNKWTENKPFLWLVDFTEDDEPNYDYKEINKNKINRCTEEVRYIIGEYKTA